ncbi:MAG: sulfatase family protein [Planctomycetota bacterium]|jgi:arylsulfatase A-like enzyme
MSLALGASVFVESSWADAAGRKPNIIFFLVDDYDKPEISVYGGNVLTPNLERLAKEGITFHNAHMTSTVCTPSRYTCLTGRYAGSSYSSVYLEECPPGRQGLPAFNVALEDDNMNVGRVLAQNGYATGFVGKYHVGPRIEENNCAEYGLHYIPKNCEYSDRVNRQFAENERRYRQLIMDKGFTWAKNIYWENTKAPFKGHNPEWTIDAALEFIEKHKDGPFYLHYATTLLHGPNSSWFKSLDKPMVTGEGIIKKPLNVMPQRKTVMQRVEKAGLTENEAGYLWMDDSIGMLLDKLDELGIAENTLVLFIADHGSEMKGSLYKNKGTEVPCIMRWPAGMKKNVRCYELIQNTDFVPTWFELAGVRPPGKYKMDGVSIAPLFANPKKPVREYVYGEMGAARSIKTKDWSYISLRYSRDQIDAVGSNDRRVMKKLQGLSGGISRGRKNPNAFNYDQLYNLAKDPLERNNLVLNPEYGAKLKEMKGLLTAELKRFPGRPYGEFVPGGNASPIGSFDDILDKMTKATKQDAQKPKKPAKRKN